MDRENYQEIIQSLQTDQSQSRVNNVQQILISMQEEEEDNTWVLNILEDLVTVVMDDDSQLKSLDIVGSGVSSVDWASVSPELLAKVLVSLEGGSFDLESPDCGQKYRLTVRPTNQWIITRLTPDHITSLFTKIADSSVMNVKSLALLYFGGIPPIPFAPKLLSQAVTKLETFGIIDHTADQISAVLTKLSVEKDHKLRTLALTHNDLSSVPTDILVAGISGLEKVDLSWTSLTSQQLTGIFSSLSDNEGHKLRDLNLRTNDLSSVPTETLVAGISGLEKVNLAKNVFFGDTVLTTEQLTGIFSRLSVSEDQKLKTLTLECNKLSSVPTETLVAGISCLEEVNLKNTYLTTEQLEEIYRMVADRRCPRMRKIDLGENDKSFHISKDILDRAKLNQSVVIYDDYFDPWMMSDDYVINF